MSRLMIIGPETAASLREDYLQLLEDLQTHTVPPDEAGLQTLARRIMGAGTSAAEFAAQLTATLKRVSRT